MKTSSTRPVTFADRAFANQPHDMSMPPAFRHPLIGACHIYTLSPQEEEEGSALAAHPSHVALPNLRRNVPGRVLAASMGAALWLVILRLLGCHTHTVLTLLRGAGGAH